MRRACVPLLPMVLVVSAGCYHHAFRIGAYEPHVADSLVRDAWGAPLPNGRRVGCLELWSAPIASTETAPGDVLVDLRFGNRCSHPTPIDFTRLRLTIPAAGLVLEPWDPRAELHPARVQALTRGEERIEFHGVHPPAYRLGATAGRAVTLCIAWAAMIPGDDAAEGERAPICNTVWP